MSEITIIAAMGINAVIGNNGEVPWKIPSELSHFKRETVGNICIMGRKTYESLKRPLPNRTHIVMSRDPSFLDKYRKGVFPPDVFPAPDVSSAVKLAEALAGIRPYAKVMVIGGAEIYRQFISLSKKMILTVIHLTPDGDAKFPCHWSRGWVIVSCETRKPQDLDEAGYSVLRMER
jgi:dihydrofolate reductase